MKTILFFESELAADEASPAKCNDLYKVIYKHLKNHRAKTFFNLQKWNQPTGSEILDKIEEWPDYMHYCGHGNESGELLYKSEDGKVEPLKNALLEKYIESHFKIECVLLGSCNSDILTDLLRIHADYTIGFTNSPLPDFVFKFYDEFYVHLSKHGSPFKAFFAARDRLMANRIKTEDGAIPVLKSKHNYIMELIALNEQSAQLRSAVAEKDLSISQALNKLASLKGEARSVFEQLLLEHPFAEDVFWFHSFREKLAHDIAMQIMEGEEEDNAVYFNERLDMAFEVLEKILVAYEEKDLSKGSLSKIGKDMPKEETTLAFRRLEKNELFKNRSQGFRDLLSESAKFCLKELIKN